MMDFTANANVCVCGWVCVFSLLLRSRHTLVTQETNYYLSNLLSLHFNYLCTIIMYRIQLNNCLSLFGFMSILIQCNENIEYFKLQFSFEFQVTHTYIVNGSFSLRKRACHIIAKFIVVFLHLKFMID